MTGSPGADGDVPSAMGDGRYSFHSVLVGHQTAPTVSLSEF